MYDVTPEQLAASEARQAKFEAMGRRALQRMNMTDEPDYTAMSGAEFQRAVGADPAKWAAAFCQRMVSETARQNHIHVVISPETVAVWFRDAMHAAVKAHKPE